MCMHAYASLCLLHACAVLSLCVIVRSTYSPRAKARQQVIHHDTLPMSILCAIGGNVCMCADSSCACVAQRWTWHVRGEQLVLWWHVRSELLTYQLATVVWRCSAVHPMATCSQCEQPCVRLRIACVCVVRRHVQRRRAQDERLACQGRQCSVTCQVMACARKVSCATRQALALEADSKYTAFALRSS